MSGKTTYYRPLKRRRILGFAIDLLAIGILTKSITLIYSIIVNSIFLLIPISTQRLIVNNIDQTNTAVFIILYLTYFFVSIRFGEGQTLGKIIMKTTVVNNSNQLPSLAAALLRSMGYLIYYGVGITTMALPHLIGSVSAFVIGFTLSALWFLFPLFKKNGKGIPDLISNTHVVILESRTLPEVIYLPTESEELKKVA